MKKFFLFLVFLSIIVFSFESVEAAQYYFYAKPVFSKTKDLSVNQIDFKGCATLDIKTDNSPFAKKFIAELAKKGGTLVKNSKSNNSNYLWQKSFTYRYVEITDNKIYMFNYEEDGIKMKGKTFNTINKRLWKDLFPEER